MSGTYRMTLMFVQDGHYNRGTNGRKSRALTKPIDRRIQRRKHVKITRDAVREYEAEQDFDMLDLIEPDYDYELEDSMYELARDYANDDDYGIVYSAYDDYDPYYEDYDYSYASNVLSREGLTRLDHNVTIAAENYIIDHTDAGKSLGELLEEALRRRNA